MSFNPGFTGGYNGGYNNQSPGGYRQQPQQQWGQPLGMPGYQGQGQMQQQQWGQQPQMMGQGNTNFRAPQAPPGYHGASYQQLPIGMHKQGNNSHQEPSKDTSKDLSSKIPDGAKKEIRLHSNTKERQKYDALADLYSIIKTTEHLEKAYIRDSITAAEYTPACKKLIAQYKTARDSVKSYVPDVEQFMRQYRMDCPAAQNRLLYSGVPATVEHGGGSQNANNAKNVAEAVQFFITTMDALKLNMCAVDQLSPLLSDLLMSLNQISGVPEDIVEKVKKWVVSLNQRSASSELDEEETRQLTFDLESAYSLFHNHLSG